MQNNLQEFIDEYEECLIYFYTPLCGTCALAESYLDMAAEIETVPPVLKADINYYSGLAADWKIESVPCILLIKEGTLAQRMYAVENVFKIYQFARGEKV